MKIETILFDLDGTLIDTEPAAARAIHTCFSDWGIRIEEADLHYIAGRTWESAFRHLYSRYDLPVRPEEASHRMMTLYREALNDELVTVPGSVEAVRALATEFPLGLVSGSNRREILWALDRLKILDLFQVILGAEDYPKSKPAPDGYLKALQILKASAQNTLIFEDSSPGVASALAAGARVVVIRSTNHFQHDTSQAHEHVVDLVSINAQWVHEFAKRCP